MLLHRHYTGAQRAFDAAAIVALSSNSGRGGGHSFSGPSGKTHNKRSLYHHRQRASIYTEDSRHDARTYASSKCYYYTTNTIVYTVQCTLLY